MKNNEARDNNGTVIAWDRESIQEAMRPAFLPEGAKPSVICGTVQLSASGPQAFHIVANGEKISEHASLMFATGRFMAACEANEADDA